MKERFQRKCDSLEAVLRKRIPEKPDSIWHKDVGEFELNGEKMTWTTSSVRKYKPDTLPQALALHPVLLYSRPKDSGTIVSVLTPSMGAVRIYSEFVIKAHGRFFDYGLNKSDMNRLDRVSDAFAENVWRTSHDQALLADSAGKLLGWVSWDSIAGFESPKQARQTQRFYTDGFADLLNGLYLDVGVIQPVFKGKPEPIQTLSSLHAYKVDMFRREMAVFYRSDDPDLKLPEVILDREYPKKNAPIFSWIKDPRTGKTVRYIDPKKFENLPVLKAHWFYDGGSIQLLPPITVTNMPECYQMTAKLAQDSLAPEDTKLVMQFGEFGSSVMEFELPSVRGGEPSFRPQGRPVIYTKAVMEP